MRRILVMALACAALLPAQAVAAVPMKAVIVHLAPSPMPPEGSSARDAVRQIEREGRRAQAPVLAQLAQLRREGHVRHVRPLWIASAVALSGDASALAALAARADVESIEADAVLPIRPADAVTGEPGIASTGAPGFWARGVDGRGITVGVLDTGVDLTHPELADHYRGGSNSWFDPYGRSAPADLSGHGTEVTGVIVAGAGIGMAPGAKFIAARAFDDAGVSTASAIHLAFQWLLDPDGNLLTNDAPNVVNLSWGARQGCNLEFQPDLQALRAAHILPVVAAGNDGPPLPPPALSPDNSPANLPEAFAVGATEGTTTIAAFSSLGPSSCPGDQFPDLVAPGTGIRSTGAFGVDATGLAGTSFSAPHVAGALALLLQVKPQLTADQQADLLTQNAVDLGTPGADSTFGAGFLDLVAAARSLQTPALDFDPPVLSGAVSTDTTAQVRADDVLSAIAGGEWWADADPGIGAGEPLAAADGTFDSHSEILVASTAALAPGPHLLRMRARDAAGNWSAAATVAIIIPTPPPPPPTAPVVPDAPPVPVAPPPPLLPSLESRLQRVAGDGFERGLGAWSRRIGAVAAIPEAAISGRRGMRATLVARAPAFVQRRLPRPGREAELAFDLNPRTLSSAGGWIEVAAITGSRGLRLASVDLRSLRGADQLRLTMSTGTGAVLHSQPQRVRRRPTALVLSLDPAQARLTVDGVDLARLARAANAPQASAIALGPWRGGPAGSSGYLDIDRVTVREAPPAA